MKHRIHPISPHPAGMMFGALYFILGLLAIPMFIFVGASSHGESPFPFGVWFPVVVPVFYGIAGYLFTVVVAWLYNVLARWIGGIEIVFDEKGPDPEAAEQADAAEVREGKAARPLVADPRCTDKRDEA